jgi:FKBP-type peptidyl-prolyl cis-trans isomerase SlyD
MKATHGTVVSLDYDLTDEEGMLLDSSNDEGPLTYLHGFGNLIPGLEKALEGAEPGFRSQVVVGPDEAYGERDPEAVFEAAREDFPPELDLEPGMQLTGETPEGPVSFMVMEVNDDGALLDGNHPLAGMTLVFDVHVVDVREASAEELAHGHAHASEHVNPDGARPEYGEQEL